MHVRWSRNLPLGMTTCIEGPLVSYQGSIFFAYGRFGDQAPDGSYPETVICVHQFSWSGEESQDRFFKVSSAVTPICSKWTFLVVGGSLYLYCGVLLNVGKDLEVHLLLDGEGVAGTRMSGRPSFLVAGDSVVYSAAIRKKWAVQKLRVSDGVAVWRHEGERPGHATAPESHGGQISFCLDGTLYMVEQEEGELVQQVSLPRLDLLFSPRRIGEDLLLGYSTWSSCGLLRYCRGKVDWRYKRRAQGPVQFPRVLYGGEVGVVVRDDRELIGVDLSTGDEAWRCPATPWLYTEVIERGGQLIFGTSGAGGRLVAVDPSTGVVTWSVEVEDGCAFFTETSEDLVFAGRCGRVFRVKKSSGAVIDEVATESILCGDIISDQNAVVAVGLDGSGDSLSLVCVSLDA